MRVNFLRSTHISLFLLWRYEKAFIVICFGLCSGGGLSVGSALLLGQ